MIRVLPFSLTKLENFADWESASGLQFDPWLRAFRGGSGSLQQLPAATPASDGQGCCLKLVPSSPSSISLMLCSRYCSWGRRRGEGSLSFTHATSVTSACCKLLAARFEVPDDLRQVAGHGSGHSRKETWCKMCKLWGPQFTTPRYKLGAWVRSHALAPSAYAGDQRAWRCSDGCVEPSA